MESNWESKLFNSSEACVPLSLGEMVLLRKTPLKGGFICAYNGGLYIRKLKKFIGYKINNNPLFTIH